MSELSKLSKALEPQPRRSKLALSYTAPLRNAAPLALLTYDVQPIDYREYNIIPLTLLIHQMVGIQ